MSERLKSMTTRVVGVSFDNDEEQADRTSFPACLLERLCC